MAEFGLRTDARDLVSRLAPGLIERYAVPGLSVAFVRDGVVESQYCSGSRDAGTGAPVKPGTVFEAASLSKPVFAYTAIDLADRGLIDLDASLESYLDEPVVRDDPRSRTITARMVLCHATGLQNWLKTSDDQPRLGFDPGSGFSYSSLGFVHLQRAIERLSGRDLNTLVTESVLAPLGMTGSSFVWRDEYSAISAMPHDSAGLPKEKWRPELAMAFASLHTTPLEFAAFVAATLAAPGESPLRQSVLDTQLAAANKVRDSVGWGLGWGLEATPSSLWLWQWGDNVGFKAFAIGSRERRDALVVMTNGDGGLAVCEAVIRAAFHDDHQCFSWLKAFYSR